MNRRSRLAALVAAYLLGACGTDQRVAGGGSSESGNAIVAGRVADAGGGALGGAKVRLIDGRNWLAKSLAGRSVVLDSARADGQGRFNLRFNLVPGLNLEVEGSSQGLLYRGFDTLIDTGENAVALVAAPYGRLSGAVATDTGTAIGILLPGTSFAAPLGSGQGFAFARVPQGEYPTLVTFGAGGPASAATGPTIAIRDQSDPLRVLAVEPGSLRLEDFSLPWPKSLMAAVSGAGGWHEVRDIGAPLFQKSTLARPVTAGAESFDGASMHMTCVLDSLYAGIGLHVGDAPRGLDWTGMRSLSFQAKGKGRIRVSVESLMLDSLGQDQFSYLLDIPAAWKRVVIPVDSLRLTKGSPAESRGIAWGDAARNVTRVEFVVKRDFAAPGDTTEFWLDDVTVTGVPIESFRP